MWSRLLITFACAMVTAFASTVPKMITFTSVPHQMKAGEGEDAIHLAPFAVQMPVSKKVKNQTGTVTITIDKGPQGAVLSGTVTKDLDKDGAAFDDLKVNIPGNYIFRATSSTIAGNAYIGHSGSFAVSAQ